MVKSKVIRFLLFIFFFAITIFEVSAKSAIDFFNEGIVAENNEDWYTASQKFMEATAENPMYAQAWLHLAKSSYQLGDYELVLSQLENAEKFLKNNSEILNLRGMSLISLKRFDEAREVFLDILKKFPNDCDARFGLAELDLFDGKISGAEKMYNEALNRQNDNRKALLSLAVVSCENGKLQLAKKYIESALGFYSGEFEVHYFAAILYAMTGDIDESEKQIRIALEINSESDKAYEFLSKIKFAKKQHDDVVSICDYRIKRNRNASSAWYMKGLSLFSTEDYENAIFTWTKGLEIEPNDEIMRAALENLVAKYVSLEDVRRKSWALYHVEQAKECERRYDHNGVAFQYQQALKIDPSNKEARNAFADMLELNGFHELYLDQLLFIREISMENPAESSVFSDEIDEKQKKENSSFSKIKMDDTIEAYDSLLKDSLASKWDVEPFYLDKTRWNIALYWMPAAVQPLHPDNNRITAEFASDIFCGIARTCVNVKTGEAKDFGQAYQKARNDGADYFVMLGFDEGSRDLVLEWALYNGKNGHKIAQNSFYSTGNNRFSNLLRRFRNEILSHLPMKGRIIDREGKRLLIDIGKSENLVEGSIFDVVQKGRLQLGSNGGIYYDDADILGKLNITTVGEEVSEGLLEYEGFFDRVNINDEVVLLFMQQRPENADEIKSFDENIENQMNISETSPMADVNGKSLYSPKEIKINPSDFGSMKTPSFIDLIRSIY